MPNPANALDVEARWRPLSEQEIINAETFLADAWRKLSRSDLPGIEDRMDGDADLTAEVVRVLATAVLRVMKNPDGKRQESIDDYSWTRDESLSAGLLFFTDEEIEDLTPTTESRGGAFSFNLLGADYPDARFPDEG